MSNGLAHCRPRESSVGGVVFIATFRAESQTLSGAACYPTTTCREAPMPLLTELEHHPLGQPGYRHRAPSGAVRHCSRVRGVQAKGRLKAVHGGRYLRGSWLAARRVKNRSTPVTACGACYFGIRISAFFRISGFGFRIWETNSSCEREQPNPSYGIFRRMVSRCAQSGFGAG
jgi:hypothetical protein